MFTLLLMVGACGFEPLYVQKKQSDNWYFSGEFDPSISAEISQIKIEQIQQRFGQVVRNELLDSLTPRGAPKKPKYRLFVDLQDKQITQQALRSDITATRERVRYKVLYRLKNDKNEVLVEGDSIAYVSYDILANPYSTTMAKKKTEKDAAKIIANDISLRLGAYFHSYYSKKGNLNKI